MKTLLLLNGPEGWQTGIEDGFSMLLQTGEIKALKWFYFNAYARAHSDAECLREIRKVAEDFQPELVVFFHVADMPVTAEMLDFLKGLQSKPYIVYDEGDMYGGFNKRPTRPMKVLMKYADAVSIRGLGKWASYISRWNKNIIYTPHHNDVARFDIDGESSAKREHDLILIGNHTRPRVLGGLRSIPGVKERAGFARYMEKSFGSRFKLYGNRWDSFQCNCGPVDFQRQTEYYRNTWVTVAYEHYPDMPYYFSNRLPAALMAGSLYVCHYQPGYEKIFDEGDFIFFFRSNREAVDIVNYIFSLEKEDLLSRSCRAAKFATERYSPEVAWRRFFRCVKDRKRGQHVL